MTSPRRSQTGAGAARFGVFLFPLPLPRRENRLGQRRRADSFSRVAAAKRATGRFDVGQTPANGKIAWDVIPGSRQSFRRAPVFSLPPCTAHSLFSQNRGPRKIRRFCGERRKEWSRAQSSPPGGDGAGGISSDDMGGALDQPSSWLTLPGEVLLPKRHVPDGKLPPPEVVQNPRVGGERKRQFVRIQRLPGLPVLPVHGPVAVLPVP